MDHLAPPKGLDLSTNVAENWRRFKQQFQIYVVASGLGEKDDKVQAMTFLHVAGPEALEVYNTFDWAAEGDNEKLQPIMGKFGDHCDPQKIETFDRYVFKTRMQGPGEKFDAFLTDLKTLSRTCDFGDKNESLVRDGIVFGIRNDHLRAKFLKTRGLTLAQAIDQCRADELSERQMKTMSAAADVAAEKTVHAVYKGGKKPPAQKPQGQHGHGHGGINDFCKFCGGSHAKGRCPAWGQKCHNCQKSNHYAKMCYKKQGAQGGQRSGARPKQFYRQKKVNAVDNYDDEEEMFMGSVDQVTSQGRDAEEEDWDIDLTVNGKVLTGMLDSGAKCNVISKKTWQDLGKNKLFPTKVKKLVGFGGSRLDTCGKTIMDCEYKGNEYSLEFQVVDEKVTSIVGLPAIKQMGVLQRVMTVSQKDVCDILEDYDDVFTGLGCLEGEYHIEIDPTTKPVVHAPHRVPVALRDGLKMN
jgi:hypothetical protein